MSETTMVRLMAGVLFNRADFCVGKVCPVCGGPKAEEMALACSKCNSTTNGNAVVMAIQSAVSALIGHNAARKTGVQRDSVFTDVIANLKVAKNAKMVTPDNPEIKPYLQYGISVVGGFLNVSVFGATQSDIGQTITGVVELKTKIIPSGVVNYLRIQKIDGVVSDVNLKVKNFGDTADLRTDLPREGCRSILNAGKGEQERLVHFQVGFSDTPVAKTA